MKNGETTSQFFLSMRKYKIAWGKNAITEGKTPHIEYLQIAGYLGIPGLLLYLSALLSLARHHWKNIRGIGSMVVAVSGVMIVYLFSACFGNPVFHTFPFFRIFYGLTAGAPDSSARQIAPVV